MFNSTKMFFGFKKLLVFNCFLCLLFHQWVVVSFALPPGVGLGEGPQTEPNLGLLRKWTRLGSLEVVDISWAKRMEYSFPPHPQSTPGSTRHQPGPKPGLSFLFRKHPITVRQLTEKGGHNQTCYFSPIFFPQILLCQIFKTLQIQILESKTCSHKQFAFLTIEKK